MAEALSPGSSARASHPPPPGLVPRGVLASALVWLRAVGVGSAPLLQQHTRQPLGGSQGVVLCVVTRCARVPSVGARPARLCRAALGGEPSIALSFPRKLGHSRSGPRAVRRPATPEPPRAEVTHVRARLAWISDGSLAGEAFGGNVLPRFAWRLAPTVPSRVTTRGQHAPCQRRKLLRGSSQQTARQNWRLTD
jgi:hypothetical protein